MSVVQPSSLLAAGRGATLAGRTAGRQAMLALALLVLFLLPAGFDLVPGQSDSWGSVVPVRANGRFVNVLSAQSRSRMINISLGLAARWAASGRPIRFELPRHLDDLAQLPPDPFAGGTDKPAMQPYLTRLMAGHSLRLRSYDPRVSTSTFDALLSGQKTREFPFHIYAVRPVASEWKLPLVRSGSPMYIARWSGVGRNLIAVADEGSDRIAIVPFAISPFDLCWSESGRTNYICPKSVSAMQTWSPAAMTPQCVDLEEPW